MLPGGINLASMSTGDKVSKVGDKISETASAAKDATAQACADAKASAVETKDTAADKAHRIGKVIKE